MYDVVACDDHGIVRAGIRRLLEETDDLRVVREASNGEEYLAEINRLHQISPSSISTFPTATGLIC
jgi:DNA-binding NarL/FixJ family response regulator